jgi:hypothetical protein
MTPSPRGVSLLRHLQQNALDDVFDEHRPLLVTPETFAGWSPPLPMDKPERRRVIDRNVRRIESAAAELPTEFEDPVAYLVYRDVLARLEPICAILDLGLPERLWFGTLATPKLNSRVLLVDEATDEYLIVISRQFVPFCHQFGGFLANVVAPELERRADEGGEFSRPPVPSTDEIERLFFVVADLSQRFKQRTTRPASCPRSSTIAGGGGRELPPAAPLGFFESS